VIYGFFYRALMRLAHRFDWHYAPVHGPISAGSHGTFRGEGPSYQLWCQWCGFRQTYPYDPRKPIPGPLRVTKSA
jgi:hypothetical protein